MSYRTTFDGSSINDLSTPLGYFASNRTFDLYSEDMNLVGQIKPYTVQAYLTEYDTVTSSVSTANIEFIDPCPIPEDLTAPDQTDPEDYYYTGDSPSAEFTANPWVVEPPVCAIEYSCRTTGSPMTPLVDLCDFNDGDTVGNFDAITGNYSFKTIDLAKYPPGDYVFEVTGTVGNRSVSKTFTLTLVDPCPTATLTLNVPLIDKEYTLRDPQVDQTWNTNTVLTKDTQADCGPITAILYNWDNRSAPLDSILSDQRGTPNNFAILYSEDVSKKGTYNVGFEAYYTNYPGNKVTADAPVVMTVIDPCDAPSGITVPTYQNQEYTITDDA